MSSPCFKCGVRPDVACRHRPADPDWTPPPAAKERRIFRDGGVYRVPNIGNYKPLPGDGHGHNFRTRKRR